MKTNVVVGREPAVLLGTVAAVFQLITGFGFDVSPQLQSIITAVVVGLFGLYVAIKVGDGIKAAIIGLAQAGLSLFVYYGLDWSTDHQAKVLGALSFLLGLWIHDRVVAPLPAAVSPPGKLIADEAPPA